MKDAILSLTKKLISIESTKENPKALWDVLNLCKNELTGFTIQEFESNNIPSILVHSGPKRQNFKIILNAHIDVVPGLKHQYVSVEQNGRLYGRGTFDMKAAAAVELLVFKEVVEKVGYPIALQLVTDEEIGGYNGTKYQIDQGIRADFSISGEGTDLKIKNEAKGVLWADLKVTGKTAHAAYLWNGRNAIRMMNEVLSKLTKTYPIPKKPIWKTTLNIAQITTSNTTYNKVAPDCTIGIDIRYIPKETDSILSKLKKILPSYVELVVKEKEPAQFTAKQNPFVKKLQKSIRKIAHEKGLVIQSHGASDIRHFNRVGCQGVEFGPTGYGLHTDDEWVSIESLDTYYQTLRDFLLRSE